MNLLLRFNAAFRSFERRAPYLAAGASAAVILSLADVTCQRLEQRSSTFRWQTRRTFALTCFGLFYYGGPCKFLYLRYDRWFPLTLGATRTALRKTFVDVCLHTPFLLLPSFYLITGTVKGQRLEESLGTLRSQWLEAATGSVLFWLPVCTMICIVDLKATSLSAVLQLCAINFRLVPQLYRIPVGQKYIGSAPTRERATSLIRTQRLVATTKRSSGLEVLDIRRGCRKSAIFRSPSARIFLS